MPKNDLTAKLTKLVSGKKVLILIDGANLYFSSHKKNWNIDFKQILSWFKQNSTLTDATYYTAYNPEDAKQSDFLDQMQDQLGYRIYKKPVKIQSDETRKGNLDVEITVDAMKAIFSYEVFVLVSGDGDFTYLLETLELLGKKVIVIGIGGFVSYELHKQADNFFFFDRISKVWQKPKQNKISVKNLSDQKHGSKNKKPKSKKSTSLNKKRFRHNSKTSQFPEIFF